MPTLLCLAYAMLNYLLIDCGRINPIEKRLVQSCLFFLQRNMTVESNVKKPRSSLFIKVWVSLVCSVVVAAVLAVIILVQGRVSGVEFSPTHFQQRTFQFYEIPVIEQQITPITRTTVNRPTLKLLRNGGFVQIAANRTQKWDLVSISRGLSSTIPADAELLAMPLREDVNSNNYWEQWIKKNPNNAKFLWGTIQKLAIRGLYLFVPPLLEIAQRDSGASDFRDKIYTQLQIDYERLTKTLRGQNKTSIADKITEEAKMDFPKMAWP